MLKDLDIRINDVDVPHFIDTFISEADSRIDDFLDEYARNPVSRFLPSDHRLVYSALQTIARDKLAPGTRFCEWGCGFAVATGLAAMLGFDASGIEIEPRLTRCAEQLMSDFDIHPVIYEGSYVPAGYDYYNDNIGDTMQLIKTAEEDRFSGWYEDWDFSVEELDVVFVYPWPREEEFFEQLFDNTAAEGALLVTYRGLDDITIKRRTAGA